jgi:pyruvate dehydrogenase E2 component (dihydrolipoamide acetyltransferase)
MGVTVTDLLLVALAHAVATPAAPDPALGLAVATDDGVLIPVIRGVAGLGLGRLAGERSRAVERARSGRLEAADLSSSPVSTLSNLGAFGVDQFTGVIASGQATLLTVGRIRDRVVVRGRALEARPTMFATLNVDHRALDGSDAAKLLDRFATAVERPDTWERSRA